MESVADRRRGSDGAFAGWYKLDDWRLQIGILILGIVLSSLVLVITFRDGGVMKIYMKEIKEPSGCPWGRAVGYLIVFCLIVADAYLFYFTLYPH